MSTEVLEMEVRLKDYMSSEINKITASLKGLEGQVKETSTSVNKSGNTMMNTFKGFALAEIAMKGAEKAYSLLKDSISDGLKDLKEDQAAQIRLQTALGGTSSALLKQAEALSKVTLYRDGDILAAQSSMASMIKDENLIKRLIPLTLDLAAAKGVSLTEASNAVTRAIISADGSMRGLGIKLEGAAGSTQRMDSAVRKLTEAFGGQAKAIADSDFGKIEQLSKSIEEIKKSVAEAALPSITKLVEYVQNTCIPVWESWGKAIDKALNPRAAAEKDAKENMYQQLIKDAAALRAEITKLENDQKNFGGMSVLGGMADTRTIEAKRAQLKMLIEDYKKLGEELGKGKGSVTSGAGSNNIVTTTEQVKQKSGFAGAALEENFAKYREFREKQIDFDEGITEQSIQLQYAAEAAKLANIQDSQARAVALIKNRYDQEAALIEAQKNAELQKFQGTELEKGVLAANFDNKIRTLRSKEKVEIAEANKSEMLSKKQTAENMAGSFSDMLGTIGKATKANANQQKAISIVQSIINTALAASKANSATPYPPVNAALMAIAIAQGVAQTAVIANQKFAYGGVVQGTGGVDSQLVRATPGEMYLNDEQQAKLFNMLQPSSTTTNNSQSVNLHINVGSGGNYDMNAAQYTVDQLKPIIGKVLIAAHRDNYLNDYYNVR